MAPQQTAVDWIVDQMLSEGHKEMWKDMIQQAKQMEKEQIIDAFYQCGKDNFEHIKIINRSATEYYNETYGKQS